MRTEVTTRTLYTYAELDAYAQDKARDWYRDASAYRGCDFYAEVPTDEFHELLAACGFHVDDKRGLQWSGFSSQGDGAAFAGTWYASDCKPQALLANRPAPYKDRETGATVECKHNKRWHDAIAPLVELARTYPQSSGEVRMSSRGNNMRLESFELGDDENDSEADASVPGETFIEAARDLANAFYRELEAGYDYQNSDENVAETIIANEYEFTKDGKRA